MSRRFLAGWTCTWAPDAQTPNCLSENRDEHLLSWIIFVFHSLNFYEWISFCTSRVGGKTFTGRIGGWKKVPFQNFRKTELSKRLLIFQWLQQSAGLFSKRTRWAPIPRPAGHSWFLWQLHPPLSPGSGLCEGRQRLSKEGWAGLRNWVWEILESSNPQPLKRFRNWPESRPFEEGVGWTRSENDRAAMVPVRVLGDSTEMH